jgi:hypothetical protein
VAGRACIYYSDVGNFEGGCVDAWQAPTKVSVEDVSALAGRQVYAKNLDVNVVSYY